MTALSRSVASARDPSEIARFLWTVEGLSLHYLLQAREWPRFSDPLWPRRAMPMTHSGLGIAACLVSRFQPKELASRIQQTAAPGFLEFAWEAVGALLGLLSHRGFRSAVHVARLAGMVSLPEPPRRPSLTVGDLPAACRTLAGHGLGRHFFFTRYRMRAALEEARSLPAEIRGAATRGLAGAFALVNAGELASALRAGEELDEVERGRFDDGMVNALTLLVWTPGRAPAIASDRPRTAALLGRARAIAAEAGPERLGILV